VRFLSVIAIAVSVFAEQQPAQKPPPAALPVVVPTGAAQTPATTPAVVPQGPYEFTSDVGAFLIVVKADKAASFDAAMAKLKLAFTQSTATSARKQQASGWRIFKSTETATGVSVAIPAAPATATAPATAAVPASAGTITYLFLIDPVVKKTSYDPIEILRELMPNEVQAVYDQLNDGWVSATRIGLTELMRLGTGGL
jgi:hypothetical protein